LAFLIFHRGANKVDEPIKAAPLSLSSLPLRLPKKHTAAALYYTAHFSALLIHALGHSKCHQVPRSIYSLLPPKCAQFTRLYSSYLGTEKLAKRAFCHTITYIRTLEFYQRFYGVVVLRNGKRQQVYMLGPISKDKSVKFNLFEQSKCGKILSLEIFGPCILICSKTLDQVNNYRQSGNTVAYINLH